MRNQTVLIIVVLSLLLFISGCVKENIDSIAKKRCIELCMKVKNKIDLSSGPCLSDNNIEWDIDNWVCDVAHWPRKSIDNIPENQCQEYRKGYAKHFVEVDENCNFIRMM